MLKSKDDGKNLFFSDVSRSLLLSRDGAALQRFLEDYFAGVLEKYLKSEPIPENNDGPVKVISNSRV